MTILCDARDTILIDFMDKGKTTTGQYYMSLLERLSAGNKEKTTMF